MRRHARPATIERAEMAFANPDSIYFSLLGGAMPFSRR